MNRLDLPNRCLAEIDAQEGDGSAYYTACCRPLGHPTGHMSLAVDDRKEAARRMGISVAVYREREARHEGDLRIVGHIALGETP